MGEFSEQERASLAFTAEFDQMQAAVIELDETLSRIVMSAIFPAIIEITLWGLWWEAIQNCYEFIDREYGRQRDDLSRRHPAVFADDLGTIS